jgi:Spy/CpxP family protein refolding chaperone
MKQTCNVILATLVVAAAVIMPALSQTTHQPPDPAEMAQRQVKTLTTLLSLTSAQQQQATTIFTNSARSEQSLHQAERTAHDALRTAVKNNDSAAIEQAAGDIGQSVTQMTAIKAKADAAFYQILTADQQTKMSELESQHLGFEGHGAPPAMGFR